MRWPWRRSRPERDWLEEIGSLRERGSGQDSLQMVKVAYARNLAEAELIQGMLRLQGIPSMVRRNGGFDVPDLIAAGPRDVLVAVSQADRARELLA